MDKRFLTIGIIMFTEVIGFSLILPFIPYFAEDLGASPLIVGLIIATFSFFQFFSAPVIGKLSDRFGRRPLLIISQFSTLAGFMILGFANSLWMLFLSRLVDGLLGSNMTLTRTYLTDVTEGKDRAKKLGYFGAIFGLGFFIGPAIGGFLAAINYSIPAFIAAGVTLISIVLTFLFLPETVKKPKDLKLRKNDFFPIKDLREAFNRKELRRIFIEFFFFIFAFSTLTSSLALFIKHQVGFGPEDVGMALLIIGLTRTTFQLTAMPRLIDKYDLKLLMTVGLVITSLSMFASFFIADRVSFYIVMLLFATGGGLVRPMMVNDLSNLSKPNERGKLMGVFDSIMSVSNIFGPLIGGLVIENTYPGYLGIIAGTLVLTAFFIELGYKTKLNKT